jgi:hypothetical protein
MQRRCEIRTRPLGGAGALLVFSIRAVHDGINLPECGADEGQMRQSIEYLVACRGAERAAAPMAVGISQQSPCKDERADRFWAAVIEDESLGANIATFYAASGSPITTIYDREEITEAAIEEIASAFTDFGLFD